MERVAQAEAKAAMFPLDVINNEYVQSQSIKRFVKLTRDRRYVRVSASACATRSMRIPSTEPGHMALARTS